jgi:hypothetical protein
MTHRNLHPSYTVSNRRYCHVQESSHTILLAEAPFQLYRSMGVLHIMGRKSGLWDPNKRLFSCSISCLECKTQKKEQKLKVPLHSWTGILLELVLQGKSGLVCKTHSFLSSFNSSEVVTLPLISLPVSKPSARSRLSLCRATIFSSIEPLTTNR